MSAFLTAAPAHLVGHSLGGRLAQAPAQRWPQSVGQTILISTSVALRERRGWLCSGAAPIDENFLAYARRESAAVPDGSGDRST
ncbi:alpha/beta hydrolase fold protein [Mesorhizobium alhagi CCNWXJ12-2]|uniref:Alpha/beta hydrolase fold protein n=1 Tax=Mesorhizobium alhagi CCNWXJ12-2 TaxID=1107882 RepID=H0HZC4_9HYPH|nr:alpha/beta hydrolase fold protein [Mesorhizobium alhagi CCNWXJ12-2]